MGCTWPDLTCQCFCEWCTQEPLRELEWALDDELPCGVEPPDLPWFGGDRTAEIRESLQRHMDEAMPGVERSGPMGTMLDVMAERLAEQYADVERVIALSLPNSDGIIVHVDASCSSALRRVLFTTTVEVP